MSTILFITNPTTLHHSFICLALLGIWVCGSYSKSRESLLVVQPSNVSTQLGKLRVFYLVEEQHPHHPSATDDKHAWLSPYQKSSMPNLIPNTLCLSSFPLHFSINIVLPHSSLIREASSTDSNFQEVLPSYCACVHPIYPVTLQAPHSFNK